MFPGPSPGRPFGPAGAPAAPAQRPGRAGRDESAGAREAGDLYLLQGYGRRSPLVRLVPFLLVAAALFLVGFGGFVIRPDLERLIDLRAQATAADEAAMAAEAALKALEAAAAQRDGLRRQVEAAEARLVPITGLSALAVRLDGYARDTGAILLGVQFGQYLPLGAEGEPGQREGAGAPASRGRGPEGTPGEARGTGGSGAAGSETPDGAGSGATGAEGTGATGAAGANATGAAGANATGAAGASATGAARAGSTDGAGSSPAAYGSVAFTARLQGSWEAVEGWFRQVAEREPALWIERVAVSESAAGVYQVQMSGRLWVEGQPPGAVAASSR